MIFKTVRANKTLLHSFDKMPTATYVESVLNGFGYRRKPFELNQKPLTEVFDKAKGTISEHIKPIFEDGELVENSVVLFFRADPSSMPAPATLVADIAHAGFP